MVVYNRCFEQYCIFKQRNVRFEESLFKNGQRVLVCKESHDCPRCRNHILPYCPKMLNL